MRDPEHFERQFPMTAEGLGSEWRFTELGEGNCGCDFAEVLGKLEGLGYDGYVSVEQDISELEPIECARHNRRFLKNLGYQAKQ